MRRRLAAESWLRELVVVKTVDSTNQEVRRRISVGGQGGLVVVAEEQSAGRGRMGRSWHSPAGLGLYLSVGLAACEPAPQWTRWTVGTAVAACEACREVAGSAVEIEWPNDVVFRGRKLAGVLAESWSAEGRSNLILGVGFNVDHRVSDFPPDLRDRATSLRQVADCGIVAPREGLAVGFLRALGRIQAWLVSGDWQRVARRWERLAPRGRGARVEVVPPPGSEGRSSRGVTAGLDPSGALRVRIDDGHETCVHFTESVVSLESG